MVRCRAVDGGLVLTVIVFSLLGCQNVDQVMQSHYRLETASQLTSKGEYLEAVKLLETLLADVETQRDAFVRQRFFACYLLTQAQILQGLSERAEATPTQFRSLRINPRIMTAMLYVGSALEVIDAAEASESVSATGQRLVPGRLEEIPFEDMRNRLELLIIGFYGALRFNDKMRIAIDRFKGLGDLTKLESCAQVFDRTHLAEGVRPWLKLAIHRYIRRSDPKEAYRFAISALHDENCKFDTLTRVELIEWIKDGSVFVFLCNQCDQKVVPDRPKCFNCGESYLKAYGAEREK